MAIDTTLFAADLPAGTYTAGQIIPLVNIAGPANVRSGRGAAKLKNTLIGMVMTTGSPIPFARVHVKNSDWIDDIESVATPLNLPESNAAMDEDSGSIQIGHDCDLTPNSGWQVYAEIIRGVTSTVAASVFALIDVDYPSVSSVQNPKNAVGVPTSIEFDRNVTTFAFGNMVGATWAVESVDYFKAGFEYCLEKVEFLANGGAAGSLAFVAFANAAGMGGLQRIIPATPMTSGIKYAIKYASPLVKGPMDVKTMVFTPTAGTGQLVGIHDYVRKRQ